MNPFNYEFYAESSHRKMEGFDDAYSGREPTFETNYDYLNGYKEGLEQKMADARDDLGAFISKYELYLD